jgi:nucleotide-binding universal stress UspA family protein
MACVVSGTYLISGALLAFSAWLFASGALSATGQVFIWIVVFFFASAGASAGYLTVSEIFPIEIRAEALAVFFAIAQVVGAAGAAFYGVLIGNGGNRAEGEQRATAEAELRATVDEELGDQAVQTELRISAGLAGRVIVETARHTHAQLVVLAARTGMAVMPGTVSQYVLLKSHCPVTIVRHDGKDEETDDNHP